MYSWLLNSFLYQILKAQLQFKIWITFKKNIFLQQIIFLLYNSKIILGFLYFKKFIIIFLKYKDLNPILTKYKITHKPTKKKLKSFRFLTYYKLKSPQSFFFFLNLQFFWPESFNFTKFKSNGYLLLKIN